MNIPQTLYFQEGHSGKCFSWLTKERTHLDEWFILPKLESLNSQLQEEAGAPQLNESREGKGLLESQDCLISDKHSTYWRRVDSSCQDLVSLGKSWVMLWMKLGYNWIVYNTKDKCLRGRIPPLPWCNYYALYAYIKVFHILHMYLLCTYRNEK